MDNAKRITSINATIDDSFRQIKQLKGKSIANNCAQLMYLGVYAVVMLLILATVLAQAATSLNSYDYM